MSFYIAVCAIAAPLIYMDAVTHGIGRSPVASDLAFNLSAGVWALLVLVLWPIFVPLYLIHREAMLDHAQQHPVKVNGWQVRTAIWLIVSGLLLVGAWHDRSGELNAATPRENTQTVDLPQTASEPASMDVNWNQKDEDAAHNGNIKRAVRLLKAVNPHPANPTPDAEAAFKTPWQYYGQWLCYSGAADVVMDYPPGSEMARAVESEHPGEVAFLHEDGVVLDFLLVDGTGNVRVGDTITACGYPVGRMDVPAPAGGFNTHLVLVGKISP